MGRLLSTAYDSIVISIKSVKTKGTGHTHTHTQSHRQHIKLRKHSFKPFFFLLLHSFIFRLSGAPESAVHRLIDTTHTWPYINIIHLIFICD